LSVSPTLIQIYCTVLYCPPFCSVVLFMPPPHVHEFGFCRKEKKTEASVGNELEKHNLKFIEKKTYISCNHLFTPNILCDIGVDF
jgi:hypothetical protein